MNIYNIFHHEGIETPNETGLATTEMINLTEISGFEASRLINNEQVANYLRETLPITHLEKCPFIHYKPGRHLFYRTALGTFHPATHKIRIWGAVIEPYGVEQIRETITHEVGHNVHYNLMDKRPDLTASWERLHAESYEQFAQTGLGFVSDYARTNVHEDFAETYAAYVLDPEKLQFYNPDKYAFMQQEVFYGREYPEHVPRQF